MTLFGKEYSSAVLPDNEGPVRVVDMGASTLNPAFITINIFDAQMIEVQAEYFLRKSGVEYVELTYDEAWSILVGAYFAMKYADETGEIQTKRKEKYVADIYLGLLRMAISSDWFNHIYKTISVLMSSDSAKEKIDNCQRILKLPIFEAKIKVLSSIVQWYFKDCRQKQMQEKASDILFPFFLRARNDYFNEH